MKSLKDVNAGNDVVNNTPEIVSNDVKTEPEKIDFSKVEIEPLFKDFVDFETFSKSDFIDKEQGSGICVFKNFPLHFENNLLSGIFTTGFFQIVKMFFLPFAFFLFNSLRICMYRPEVLKLWSLDLFLI